MSDTRRCTDCHWFRDWYQLCDEPRARHVDYVFGTSTGRPLDAQSVRESESRCGPEARWFRTRAGL